MANPEHLEILKQGLEVWNRWREENPDTRPDLRESNIPRIDLRAQDLSLVDLSRANLSNANLRSTPITGANLQGTNLFQALLSGADLSNANLYGASLFGADLNMANLPGANLGRTDLRDVNFSGANLEGADLTEAFLMRTIFANVNLHGVQGLETLKQAGPSTIGIDTIFLSKGNIPESFLRGCGLSDVQIEVVRLHNPNLTQDQITDITYRISDLLSSDAIRYNSCFISYSNHDEAFARQLHDDLQGSGVRCWFAPEDMKIGDKIRSTIDQSIRFHDKLLIILSENSLNSTWVETEVEIAFAEERKRKQTVLFPLRLDNAVMETDEAWAAEICDTRHIGDFSRWKDHDAHQEAFERLLRDLKAEGR